MTEVAADIGGQRGSEEGAETKPKDSLLRSAECNEDHKNRTFIGTLERDRCRIWQQ